MRKVVIIGGGAAGMMAACIASAQGKQVLLVEKNDKLGKKIYITGKGRCNLTNDIPVDEFFQNVVSNPKFLFSALNNFSPSETMTFFENNGLILKTERGNRVFPASDKASDVTKTFEKILRKNGVDVQLNTEIKNILVNNDCVIGVITSNGEKIYSDSVIICTGGISYPLTGSTGDGYIFARKTGHDVIECKPGLVGLELKGNSFVEMQGISLKNVNLSLNISNKTIYSAFGEMLFTHYGISGPIVLSASSLINRINDKQIDIFIDLKPALSEKVLEDRLLREFKENRTKDISNVMRSLLPKAMINQVLTQACVNAGKNCSEITAVERSEIIKTLKGLHFVFKKLRPIEEAIITAGGVSVKQINPKTMESKLVKNLFFSGEVIDVDAFTGGYNLQLAFSTGYVAGKSC